MQQVEALEGGWLLGTSATEDLRKEVAMFAQQQGWLVLAMRIEQKTLKEVFKELTK